MPGITDWVSFWKAGRLAGRAYVDAGGGIADRRKNVWHGGVSQCVRQNEFCDDDSAGAFQRLEDLDGWRRYRLDETGSRRAAVRHQSRIWLFWGRAGHEWRDQ